MLQLVMERIPLKKEMASVSPVINSPEVPMDPGAPVRIALTNYINTIKALLNSLRKAIRRQSRYDLSVLTLSVASDLSPSSPGSSQSN